MNVTEPGRAQAFAPELELSPTPVTRSRRRSLVARLALPGVLAGLERWNVGRLTVHLPDGRVRTFGPEDVDARVTLRVHRERLLRAFVLRGDLGVGESYMDGDWETDDLPTFIELALRNQQAVGRETVLTRVLNTPNDLLHRLRRNTRVGSRRNVHRHYDLSNELFALFLDPSMTYSGAVFEHAGEPLEEAQQRKFARIGDRLRLGPGDHVLEIGCGWGAFAIFAARRYGCRVTGITISEQQHALARARVAEAGLADRIEIQLRDYRDVAGRFSAIVSIEMLEAVGREHWPRFFRTCDEVLAPGGAMAFQVISVPDHRFEAYARHCDWIQKYIFPGGLLPSLGELCRAMAQHTTLVARHVDDIGLAYAETLASWRAAFLARRPEVRALGFDDRFVRMWDYYLASCEGAFRARAIGNLQVFVERAGF